MKRLPLRDITEPGAGASLYAALAPVQPRQAHGRYTRLRQALGLVWVSCFLALPWLRWNGQPAVWVDLTGGRLRLFGASYWPDDLNLLAGALIVAAFALFWVTVLAGRVWCGYACPQTLWVAMFVWCERLADRTRAPRAVKHLLWVLLSLATAFTLVALFVPAQVLLPGLLNAGVGSGTGAWLVAIALATYLNAGWLREHLCVYLCPYSRFQAVMFDAATPVVSYNRARGDCVGCTLCVQVCPTGIDIRNGLQLACIACGACVDACAVVMAKMKYPAGLIAYRSEAAVVGQKGSTLRPRLVGYGLMLLASVTLLAWALANRPLLSLAVAKDRQLYRDTADGRIENLYSLTLMNKDQRPHVYSFTATGPAGLAWQGPASARLAPGEQRTFIVRLALPSTQASSQPVSFWLQSDSPGQVLQVPSRFTGPQP